jgi:WD40 repeat protein
MTDERTVAGRISSWMESEEAGTHFPGQLLSATFERTRQLRQARPQRWTFSGVRFSRSLAAAAATAVVLAVAGAGVYLGAQPTARVDLGIFESAAGRIVIGNQDGIWAVNPADRSDAAIQVTSEPGNPIGWSRDGTRLLIEKGDGNLYVLDADGSKTQVTENLSSPKGIRGSSRPTGATISPDGSRVVFAGLTKEGRSCHDGALFTVDVDGGPAEVFWESHVPQNGIVRAPTFSPDGSQIAFVDGYCDSSHSVWVANADGTDAHQILTESDALEVGGGFGSSLGAGHAYGLAWSPTGDRIALAFERNIYTFAPDGSDVRLVRPGGSAGIYWSPDGSQIETTGPWHPGTPQARPTAAALPSDHRLSRCSDSRPPVAGTVLGCSRDGTSLLVRKGSEILVILHADGSETEVADI